MVILLTLTIFVYISLPFAEEIKEEIKRTEPVYIIDDGSKNVQDDHTITVYRVYTAGIAVGEVYFSFKEGKLEARGSTYRRWRFIYDYDFFYVDDGQSRALYEKEKGKEKIYLDDEVFQRRPWLAVASIFIKNSDDTDKLISSGLTLNGKPVIIKKIDEEWQKVFYILPVESKIKKITVYIKKDESLPYRIDIEGKMDITLEKITQQ